MKDPDLRFQLLIKTRIPALEICKIEWDESHIREMLKTFCSVLKAIEAGIFFRHRGLCIWVEMRWEGMINISHHMGLLPAPRGVVRTSFLRGTATRKSTA